MKPLDILRWLPAILVLAFGVLSHALESSFRFLVLEIFLYTLPLVAQLSRRTSVRVYGMYVGAFLVLQAVVSTHFFPNTYKTLYPNINVITDVRGNEIRGISGPQHVTTEAKGFRTTKPVDYADDAPYRIFVIGGSTAEQIMLDDRKTWTHLIQGSLSAATDRDVEVVNTAVSGLRAVHNLATMRKVSGYYPDMFVILLGANDWNLHIESHYAKKTFRHYLQDYSFQYTLLGRAVHSLYAVVAAALSGEDVGDGEPKYTIDRGEYYAHQRKSLFRSEKRTFMPQAVSPSYMRTLEQIAAFCQETRAVCVLVTQPNGYKPDIEPEFMDSFWMTPPNTSYTLTFESMSHIARLYNEHLIRFAAGRSLAVCDLDAQIEPSFVNFYDEVHFNIAGARRVAAFLHACLYDVILAGRSPVSPTAK